MRLVVIPGNLRHALVAWSLASVEREACGALVGWRADGSVTVERVERIANVADHPEAFEIDSGAVVALDHALCGTGLEIVGFWHSHASGDGAPSTHDAFGAWPGALTAIVSPNRTPAVRFWRFEGRMAVEVRAVGREACRAPLVEENLARLERP